MRKQKSLCLLILFFLLTLLSCKSKDENSGEINQTNTNDSIVDSIEKSKLEKSKLIGNTYSLDEYHRINFKSETTYWIYQDPRYGCSGEGSWSIENNKVVLGPSDSNCESTRSMSKVYDASVFN